MKGMLFEAWKIVYIAEHPDIEIQTRRVVKPEPANYELLQRFCKSRYQQGETVYIKEAWRAKPLYRNYRIEYRLDNALKPLYVTEKHDCWLYEPTIDYRTPLFMPKWAARYFITITDVRAERLQEITQKDIKAEGVLLDKNLIKKAFTKQELETILLGKFSYLWNSINKDYPWESNPWVWVYTFRRVNEQDRN